jgi:hypothetical protein
MAQRHWQNTSKQYWFGLATVDWQASGSPKGPPCFKVF